MRIVIEDIELTIIYGLYFLFEFAKELVVVVYHSLLISVLKASAGKEDLGNDIFADVSDLRDARSPEFIRCRIRLYTNHSCTIFPSLPAAFIVSPIVYEMFMNIFGLFANMRSS